jgi:short-subunit dehydrogenase
VAFDQAMAGLSDKRLRGAIVVITGASAGIGKATALAFAAEGADLALISRNAERLERLRAQIQGMGQSAHTYAIDVADADAIEATAEDVETKLGPIDIWVNNAMVSVFSPVHEMNPGEFRRVTEVTYLGVIYGTLAALKRMRPRNRGVIVQVGSALAYRGIPLQSAYCAAKHAVQGFQESLQAELRHDRSLVRTTMVQLPAHNTPQFDWARSRLAKKSQPVPPIFQPEVAARAILWAAQNPKPEWLIGWPSIKAKWGNRLLPRVADLFLAKQGYKMQQSQEDRKPGTPDNLWQSVPCNFGAHGRFDTTANVTSLHLWVITHRTVALAMGAAVALALLFLAMQGPAG